jgi:hypothetical protein
MATKSFSRDIIIRNSSAVKLLKSSLEKSSSQSEWRVAPKAVDSIAIFGILSIPIFRIEKDMVSRLLR